MVNSLKWTTVDSKEVEQSKYRLEASVFNLEAKAAKEIINKCKYSTIPLIGIDGFVKKAHYGGRLKRKYISKNNVDAIGFLGSSEMLQIKPMPEKYFSCKFEGISQLKVKKNSILISRSGTIGNLTIVNKTLSKFLISEHAIRMEDVDYPGYVYSFLRTNVGQLLIQSNVYGAVVDQIEPEHLASILIPNPDDLTKEAIHNKIIQSFSLRDISNDLIDQAEGLLMETLNLPPIDQIKENNFIKNAGIKNYNVPLNFLDDRFDASYHLPIVNSIIDILLDNTDQVYSLGDERISTEIILPGRFKRVYVEEGEGTVFLGGKQIYELDPGNKKYLSVKKHEGRIERELFLHENMIAITCSGTIGKVNIIPKHWENWTMSQHVLRIVPKTSEIAGYLYTWLNSEYGRILIERHIYGSVVDEIDDRHISKVPIPLLKDKELMIEINNLVLKANKLRSEAYYLEQEAIRQVNEEVIYC